jgi:NADH:ubiquinone oxidoreductase subunit 6 (subunit J)
MIARLAILAGLVAIFFGARLVQYRAQLQGEEGIIADVFVHRPHSPNYLLLARINGRNIYIGPEHPAGIYETIEAAGRLAELLRPASSFQDVSGAFWLRLAFSSFFLLTWGAAAAAFVVPGRPWPSKLLVWLLAAVAASPIAVRTSTQLQTDGSVGVLMCGSVALGIVWVTRRRDQKLPFIYLFLTAVFLGTGKQEWTMVLALAIVGWLGYLTLQKVRDRKRELRPYAWIAAVIVAGLTAGSLTAWAYDSVNYWGGFNVLQRTSAVATIVTGENATQQWFDGTVARLPDLFTVFALMAIIATITIARRRFYDPQEALLLLFGCALFAGYFFSYWNFDDPRYFAPCLIVLMTLAVSMLEGLGRGEQRQGWRIHLPKAVISMFLVAMTLQSSLFLAKQNPNRPPSAGPPEYLDCIPLLPSAFAWNRPALDFVGSGLDRSGASGFLKQHGATLCNP